MKHFIFAAIFLQLFFGLSTSVFSVTSTSPFEQMKANAEAVSSGKVSGKIVPSISVYNVTTNRIEYKSGDVITGGFTVKNNSPIDIGEFSYRVSVVDKYEKLNGGVVIPLSFLDVSELMDGAKFLKGGEEMKFVFSYKIPSYIESNDSRILIQLEGESGQLIARSASEFVKITKSYDPLVINDMMIELSDGEKFDLGDGPMIYKNKEPNQAFLSGSLTNKDINQLVIKSQIKVYDQADRAEVYSGFMPEVSVEAGKTVNYKFELPTLDYRPGIYFAEILVTDNNGNQLTSRIGARYIISGDIATVKYLTVDKQSFKKGENFTLSYQITGRPFDISKLLSGEIKKEDGVDNTNVTGSLKISIFNNKDQLVAEKVRPLNLYTTTEEELVLVADKKASSLKIVLEGKNEKGEVFLNYEQNLVPVKSGYEGMFVGGAVLLIALVALFIGYMVYKKRKVPVSVIVLLLFTAVLQIPDISYGYVQTGSNSSCYVNAPEHPDTTPLISNVSPADNSVYTEGSYFDFTGTLSYLVCSNTAANFSLAYYNTGDGQQGSFGVASHAAGAWAHDWYYKYANFSAGGMNVGTKAGEHQFQFQFTGEYACGTDWMTGYIPYTVVCAAGRVVDANGYCSAPPPVNGACGAANGRVNVSEYPTDYCAVGAMVNGSLSGLTYSWTCAGQNGGANASCSMTVQSQCVPVTAACPCTNCPDITPPNGGGCPQGTYYCELVQECLANDRGCNAATASEFFELNPNIQADAVGPVSLKTLVSNPPLGNKGYSCDINWSKDVFRSYDYFTRCVFSGGINTVNFAPGSTTAPVSNTITNILIDTAPKMTCTQVDTGVTVSKETACRVNWSAVEVN